MSTFNEVLKPIRNDPYEEPRRDYVIEKGEPRMALGGAVSCLKGGVGRGLGPEMPVEFPEKMG